MGRKHYYCPESPILSHWVSLTSFRAPVTWHQVSRRNGDGRTSHVTRGSTIACPSDYWKRSRDSAQTRSSGQFGVCCNSMTDSSSLITFWNRHILSYLLNANLASVFFRLFCSFFRTEIASIGSRIHAHQTLTPGNSFVLTASPISWGSAFSCRQYGADNF